MSQTERLPSVSIVMSVYNGGDTLRETLDAVLAQTFADFELVAIDDGSTDDSLAVLHAYAERDSRIRVLAQQNTGLTRALNVGLRAARAALIARQDVDDPPVPERLAKQVARFAADPDLVLLGANATIVYGDGSRSAWGYWEPERLSHVLRRQTPFPHSTVMMRAEAVRRAGGYDESFVTSQDTELWMRLGRAGKVDMLPDMLIERRVLSTSISVKRRYRQFWDGLRARWRHNPSARPQMVLFSLCSLALGLLPPGAVRVVQRLRRTLS